MMHISLTYKKELSLKIEPLLELKNLTFKRNTKIILSIEDLKFCYGNIIGVVGENGIGKST